MSSMTYMNKLLDGVAVEWLVLGDVTQYEQPTKYLVAAKDYSAEFCTPVLTAGKTFILGYTDETEGIYSATKDHVIIFDDFTTANKWVDFDFKAKSSAMKMITSVDESKVLLKYIYYWLNTLPGELLNGDHKRQWIGNYSNKRIPIPCPKDPSKSLRIQAEIVRILDKLTELTTELTAELTSELTARKKQYSYYHDQLLGFQEGKVEWRTLGKIGKLFEVSALLRLITLKRVSVPSTMARYTLDMMFGLITQFHMFDVRWLVLCVMQNQVMLSWLVLEKLLKTSARLSPGLELKK